jgi:hypothetical protein
MLMKEPFSSAKREFSLLSGKFVQAGLAFFLAAGFLKVHSQ